MINVPTNIAEFDTFYFKGREQGKKIAQKVSATLHHYGINEQGAHKKVNLIVKAGTPNAAFRSLEATGFTEVKDVAKACELILKNGDPAYVYTIYYKVSSGYGKRRIYVDIPL
jgi:hypothetical protein